MMYRRFGFLQTRLLLYKQDELRELESDLDHLDGVHRLHNPKWLTWRECDDVRSGLRKKLLSKIEQKHNEYCKYRSSVRQSLT